MSENRLEQDIILSEDVINSVREWNQPIEGDAGLNSTVSKFNSTIRWKLFFIAACAVIIILVSSFAVTVGALDIGFFEVYQIIIDHIMGNVTSEYEY